MTENTSTARAGLNSNVRMIIIFAIIIAAFIGSYSLATMKKGSVTADAGAATAAPSVIPAADQSLAGADSAACACCGSAGSGEPIEGTAVLEGDVQRIDIDLSAGYYDPNTIKLKAGVPTEITFGQSSGCTAEVMSKDLGFFEDLTGGPVTVKIAALDPGSYSFSCGMEMVFGTIFVE